MGTAVEKMHTFPQGHSQWIKRWVTSSSSISPRIYFILQELPPSIFRVGYSLARIRANITDDFSSIVRSRNRAIVQVRTEKKKRVSSLTRFSMFRKLTERKHLYFPVKVDSSVQFRFRPRPLSSCMTLFYVDFGVSLIIWKLWKIV